MVKIRADIKDGVSDEVKRRIREIAEYNELNHYVGSKIFGRRCPHVAIDACAKMVLNRNGNGRLR